MALSCILGNGDAHLKNLLVNRRARLLEQELMLGVSRDVDREPAHEAEVGVGVDLEAELADVEVERLVLVEDVDL